MQKDKKIKVFADLNAWKEGHNLVMMVYKLSEKFPKREIFGLTSQMRRAVVSVTSNIAEGFGRRSSKEKVQFYSMAQGSLSELQNQLVISRDLSYLSVEDFKEISSQAVIVHKLITGLIKSINSGSD